MVQLSNEDVLCLLVYPTCPCLLSQNEQSCRSCLVPHLPSLHWLVSCMPLLGAFECHPRHLNLQWYSFLPICQASWAASSISTVLSLKNGKTCYLNYPQSFYKDSPLRASQLRGPVVTSQLKSLGAIYYTLGILKN